MSRMCAILVLLGVALLGSARPAEAQQPPASATLRFIFDWTPQGYHMPWVIASDRGYFAREGLTVSLDRGYGSGDAMAKIASGAYDVALGDVNDLVKWNAEHPGGKIITIMQYWDRAMTAILTLKGRGITSLKDLEGKRVAAPAGDSGRLMMPALGRANHFDAGSIQWVTVQPALREATLIRGEADAISGFLVTRFALMRAGVPEDDIVTFNLSESIAAYGLSVLASTTLVEQQPELLRRFLRGTLAGLRDAIADPAATIALLAKRDPLIDQGLELARYRMVLDKTMLTPHVRAQGISMVEPQRLQDTVTRMAEALAIDKPGPASELYTDALLPPPAERRLPVSAE